MAGSYQDNGDGTSTVTFEYTGLTQKVLDTLDDAGRWMYEHDRTEPHPGTTWDSLTQAQKLAVVDYWIKDWIVSFAGQQYQTDAIATARATAQAEAGDKYL